MSENGGIADVMKKQKKGDERRASYVYLIGKYGSRKAKFKDEKLKHIAMAFLLDFGKYLTTSTCSLQILFIIA